MAYELMDCKDKPVVLKVKDLEVGDFFQYTCGDDRVRVRIASGWVDLMAGHKYDTSHMSWNGDVVKVVKLKICIC